MCIVSSLRPFGNLNNHMISDQACVCVHVRVRVRFCVCIHAYYVVLAYRGGSGGIISYINSRVIVRPKGKSTARNTDSNSAVLTWR